MKILKKILAFIIILGLFGQINFVNANIENNNLLKNEVENTKYLLNFYKNKILINKGGEKLINKIDNLILKINDTKSKKLRNKIIEIKNNLNLNKGKGEPKYSNSKLEYIYYVLSYIELKLDEKKLLKQSEENNKKYNISEEDNKKVNAELIKIQNNLLNRGVKTFENFLTKLEDYSNFEEKGNFEAKLNIDIDDFGKSKASLKLKDYISKNSGFDSQFKSKIEAIIDSAPKGGEEVKLKISAFIDYILKDQNYYVLLKNLHITDTKSNEEIKNFIEKAKQLAKKNKYIKIEDKESAQILKIIKQFNPDNLLKQGKVIVSKPLFKAYKKEDNKFFLLPSKHGCDTIKKLSNTFDPINGTKCSESQYNDLLKNVSNSKIEFYIDFSGKNTKIGFQADKINNNIEKYRGYMALSDNYIEEINIIVVPSQIKFPGEGADLKYERQNYLNANFYAKKGENVLKLESKLDKNNRFSLIDLNIKSKRFNAYLKLNQHKINGKYTNESFYLKTLGVISGKTDTNNKLDKIKITNQMISKSKYNPYENLTTFEYSKKIFNLENIFSSQGTKSNLKIKGNYSNNYLSSGNIQFIVKAKKSSFDYNSYKTIYSGDFKEIVNSNITLQNRKISGKTIIYSNDKVFLKITNTGKYEKNKFELNTKIIPGEKIDVSKINPLNSFENSLNRAKYAKKLSDISIIETALQQYKLDNNYYPININELYGKYLNKNIKIKDPDGNIEINGCKFGYRYYPYGKTKNSEKAYTYIIKFCTKKYGEKITGDYEKEYYPKAALIEKKNYYINGYTNWKKIENKKPKKVNVEANFNIKTDTSSNKNNFNIYSNIKLDNKKVIELELDNKSTKIYKKTEINTPSKDKIIPLEEALENEKLY